MSELETTTKTGLIKKGVEAGLAAQVAKILADEAHGSAPARTPEQQALVNEAWKQFNSGIRN